MKIYIIFIACFILISGTFAQNKIITLAKSSESKFDVRQNLKNADTLDINIKMSKIELFSEHEKSLPNEYINLMSENLMEIFDIGKPNVPVCSKLIELPLEASVRFKILEYDEEIVDLLTEGFNKKIIPAQSSISKSEEPSIFYVDNKIYSEDKYYNTEIIAFEDVGILRDVRLGRIEIRPIQYNPVQNKLRILNNLKIQIVFSGSNYSKTKEMKTKYSSSAYDNILKNYVPNTTLQLKSGLAATYVIISDRKFQSALVPFIAHKQQLGYKVIVGYTDNPNVGITTTSIKNYLTNLYNNPPNGYAPPLYVLLVGDVAEIPSFQMSGHVSDLYYFDYTGDNLPDVFYGRFSASNTNQLIPQIEKTIEYENKTMPDVSYLQKAVLVAGTDNNHMTYSNGQINYATSQYFNSSNGIIAYAYSQPEPVNANYSSNIKSKINLGVGFANYTAHCSSSGWANPSFVTSDIANLTNDHKYGLWVGNCCLSNKFEIGECFGEAALRASNKGAVGYIGGSNNTYWAEDFYWSVGFKTVSLNQSYNANNLGTYDRMFHTHGESTNIWCNTQGELIIGGNLAVQQSTSFLKLYYWEIYHLMGDPSLNVHIKSCQNTNFTNQTVTTNTTITNCNINVQNVTVLPGKKLTLDAEETTTVNANFEVPLGAELEIK